MWSIEKKRNQIKSLISKRNRFRAIASSKLHCRSIALFHNLSPCQKTVPQKLQSKIKCAIEKNKL